jgi:hypothetical protein
MFCYPDGGGNCYSDGGGNLRGQGRIFCGVNAAGLAQKRKREYQLLLFVDRNFFQTSTQDSQNHGSSFQISEQNIGPLMSNEKNPYWQKEPRKRCHGMDFWFFFDFGIVFGFLDFVCKKNFLTRIWSQTAPSWPFPSHISRRASHAAFGVKWGAIREIWGAILPKTFRPIWVANRRFCCRRVQWSRGHGNIIVWPMGCVLSIVDHKNDDPYWQKEPRERWRYCILKPGNQILKSVVKVHRRYVQFPKSVVKVHRMVEISNDEP